MKKLLILIGASILLLSACKKDTTASEISLAYKMISDKIWFLDYNQTITATKTSIKTYVGQSTYFIKFLNNLTTVDSDGITGTYSVRKVNGKFCNFLRQLMGKDGRCGGHAQPRVSHEGACNQQSIDKIMHAVPDHQGVACRQQSPLCTGICRQYTSMVVSPQSASFQKIKP